MSEEKTVTADALFVLIGAHPHTDWLPREITRNARGFLLTGDELSDVSTWPLERRPYPLETSMPGVFAVGDVRHSSIKRVASAVGEGSIAIRLVQTLFANEWLNIGRPPEAATSGTSVASVHTLRAENADRAGPVEEVILQPSTD
jgi:thioredoxin reductase (NADPH)